MTVESAEKSLHNGPKKSGTITLSSGKIMMAVGIGNLIGEFFWPYNKVNPDISYCSGYVAFAVLGGWLWFKARKQSNP